VVVTLLVMAGTSLTPTTPVIPSIPSTSPVASMMVIFVMASSRVVILRLVVVVVMMMIVVTVIAVVVIIPGDGRPASIPSVRPVMGRGRRGDASRSTRCLFRSGQCYKTFYGRKLRLFIIS
jgi:hypothetical protein